MTDFELITQVREKQDSAAISELVNRHTGIYVDVVNRYSSNSYFRARGNVDDIKEDKFFNIYKWALKYDPSRPTESGKPMQFGTYVGDMTDYLCRNIMHRGTASVTFNEDTAPTNDTSVTDTAEKDSNIETILEQVKGSDSEMFKKIFKLRFCGKKPLSWRAIASRVDMSHEGVRKVYNKHIGAVREYLKT